MNIFDFWTIVYEAKRQGLLVRFEILNMELRMILSKDYDLIKTFTLADLEKIAPHRSLEFFKEELQSLNREVYHDHF